MKFFTILIFIFISSPVLINSARILGVYTSFGKSHAIIGQNLFKALAKRGHKVTVVSPFPLENPLPNYHDVVIPITVDHTSFINTFVENSGSMIKFMKSQQQLIDLTMQLSNDSLHTPQFQRLMREETFDLVILGYFINDFLVGLGPHFKCPLIVISATGTIKTINDFVGNPTSVAGTSHLLSNIKGPMTFWQRVKNMLIIITEYVAVQRMTWKSEAYYTENFPPDKYPPFDVVRRNTSLVLANSHFSEGRIQPNLPNMVEVGGLQIKDTPDPLPEKLQKWLDESKDGVILFSLGSNVQSSSLPPEKLRLLLDTFAKVEQRVLWKWESDELPIKLGNVMTSKWLPQDDVLAHKNVKLFVTHGGKGSLAECMFHGVPIVGIPFFGDQMVNIDAAVKEGWALRVDFASLTHENFLSAIREVTKNSKYTEVINRISNLYRDRPMTAVETATFWTEYVIRHKGAPHLRYPGVDLNIFESNSLDVLGLLLLIAYCGLKIFVVFLKAIYRCVCSKPKKLKKT